MTDMEASTKGGFLERFGPFFFILSLLLLVAVGYLYFKVNQTGKTVSVNKKAPEVTASSKAQSVGVKLTTDKAKKVPQITTADHILGQKDVNAFLVVYTDLECPYSKAFHKTALAAVDANPGKLALVFRHFPLLMLHPKGETEAQAAECVASFGGEDNFWQFIDKLLEVTPSNNGLDLGQLPKLASQVGVNTTKFNACLSGEEFKTKVKNQLVGGETAGVSGTPGVFLINKKGDVWTFPGAVSLEDLQATINEAI